MLTLRIAEPVAPHIMAKALAVGSASTSEVLCTEYSSVLPPCGPLCVEVSRICFQSANYFCKRVCLHLRSEDTCLSGLQGCVRGKAFILEWACCV